MNKYEIRAQLAICFIKGLRDLMKQQKDIEVITVEVKLVNNPNYDKAGKFKIKFISS